MTPIGMGTIHGGADTMDLEVTTDVSDIIGDGAITHSTMGTDTGTPGIMDILHGDGVIILIFGVTIHIIPDIGEDIILGVILCTTMVTTPWESVATRIMGSVILAPAV